MKIYNTRKKATSGFEEVLYISKENVNLNFWEKAISLAANFSSTGSASTRVNHKQKFKKIEFFDP